MSAGEGVIRVHPNSMAARKWGRTHWRSNLWAQAAEAEKRGDRKHAQALRRKAARAGTTEHHCG